MTQEYTRGADDARGKKVANAAREVVRFTHTPGSHVEDVSMAIDDQVYFPVDFNAGVQRLVDCLQRGYVIRDDSDYDECHATSLYKSAAHEALNKIAGAKFDSGKVDMQLVISGFAHALYEVSAVATFGAKKYTRDGWKQVDDAHHRYSAALHRHINAHERGELADPESGLSHLAHAAWNALAILQLATTTPCAPQSGDL